MAKRKIITIDEEKCNGCGLCIPNCPEGALQVIDKKARLISDLFCDGLGACIGHCPQGAIVIEEREAESYDEKKVMANIVRQGENVIKAHLKHLEDHGEKKLLSQAQEYLKEQGIVISGAKAQKHDAPVPCGCPGSSIRDLRHPSIATNEAGTPSVKRESQLQQWPVQLMLVPPTAPFFENADLLIAADCVPFAYPSFHEDLLKGKVLLVGCPKLDNIEVYEGKLRQIINERNLKSVTYAHMEVPCCFGLTGIIASLIEESGKKIPFKEVVISIKGEKI